MCCFRRANSTGNSNLKFAEHVFSIGHSRGGYTVADQNHAARALGLSRSTLSKRCKRLEIALNVAAVEPENQGAGTKTPGHRE